jgi:hypothetical protein
MENTKFKVGDECYYGFRLTKVAEMSGSNVSCVSDGVINSYGRNLDCFPKTKIIKDLSDLVKEKYDILHANKFNSLNWPDLYRMLEEKWIDLCTCENDSVLKIKIDNLHEFVEKIEKKIEFIQSIKVEDLYLIRR